MTSIEYDIEEPTYKSINNIAESKCLENDIDHIDYIMFLNIKLFNYKNQKGLLKKAKAIDFKNPILARSVLNKKILGSKHYEITTVEERFYKTQKETFEWLDKRLDPYFFILNPYYKYGAGINFKNHISNVFGYVKHEYSGTENIDIAIDYANYKLKELIQN